MENNVSEVIEENLPLIKENLPLIIELGTNLLIAVIILIAGWIIGNWLRKKITSIEKLDITLRSFLGGFVKYIVFFVSAVIVLQQLGVHTASLLAVLGAAGLAIGLALQGTLSNVAAGVMLLVIRPFNVGDFITVGGISGTVKSLGLFGCEMATPDNVYIYCPNSNIWNNDIQNFSKNDERRQDYNISISYDDDIEEAIKAISELAENEDRIIKSEDKKPLIAVQNLGDFSVDILLRVWCLRSDYFNLKTDMTKAIKEQMDKKGISIPFPTKTVQIIEK